MNSTPAAPSASTRITDANPTVLWFTTRLPARMATPEQDEWHEALHDYMRTLGIVVRQQAGFSVAIPIGREVLPTDRHELVNWALDYADEVELTLSEGHPASKLLTFCDDVLGHTRRESPGDLHAAGIFMVLRVATRALLAWRDEVEALQPRPGTGGRHPPTDPPTDQPATAPAPGHQP